MQFLHIIKKRSLAISFLSSILSVIGCNKLVQVPEPIRSVTTEQVFSTNATATAAMIGIYSSMTDNQTFSNSLTTFYAGESADELTDETSGSQSDDFFLSNSLTALSNGGTVDAFLWKPAYFDIYNANAVISGVQGSLGIASSEKSQLIGEARFIRAFCYFYLTNLLGDIPLVLTTDFNQTVLITKTPRSKIYQQIISDLLNAQNLMIGDFSLSGGQPIRANRWAATALLARVYLYQGLWQSADSAATAVIKSGQFSLVPLSMIASNGIPPSDSDVFVTNSPEAILQLQTQTVNYPYATWEGNFFISFCPTCGPNGAWLTPQLLGAFETNDLRRANWVDSVTDGNGNLYYFPYKYKVMVGQAGIPCTENYTLLRFAEQYLIRAEAEANLGQAGLALADLNTIRTRAGLPNLSGLSGTPLLQAIQQECKIEFFAEWGHRWLDLKRWGIAQGLDTISYKKGLEDSTQLLYPIPISEIQTDPNLTQNPGY